MSRDVSLGFLNYRSTLLGWNLATITYNRTILRTFPKESSVLSENNFFGTKKIKCAKNPFLKLVSKITSLFIRSIKCGYNTLRMKVRIFYVQISNSAFKF